MGLTTLRRAARPHNKSRRETALGSLSVRSPRATEKAVVFLWLLINHWMDKCKTNRLTATRFPELVRRGFSITHLNSRGNGFAMLNSSSVERHVESGRRPKRRNANLGWVDSASASVCFGRQTRLGQRRWRKRGSN